MDAGLVLQRVMPSQGDIDRLHRSYRHVIFDIDDAIYNVPPDLGSSRLVGASKRLARQLVRGSAHASSRERPLKRTLTLVDACVVGNSILGEFARRHASRVIEIPTTFEPVKTTSAVRPHPPVVVWHGLLSNLQHLALVREALRSVSQDFDFRLRIIASATWKDSPVPAEFVPWSPLGLRDGLLTASVGLAPLTDEPWTRGKCAFRAIQYAGHGLPTIASPVGITDRVVLHGKTGYLARSSKEWEQSLRLLLTWPDLGVEMGAAAIHHIRTNYSDAVAIKGWCSLLESLESEAR
jgi:glycosyltransferase involved in cell wall biosynthesis